MAARRLMFSSRRINLPDHRRSVVALLRDPVFGGLFWGQLVSSVGVWIHSVVAAIAVFQAFHSAFMVGLVSVMQFAPQLVLAPVSGAMTDRGHAWGQILLGRLLCLVGSGGLAVWIALVGTSRDGALAVAVLGSSLVVGLGYVFGGPAQQAVVPAIVRPDELATAIALNTVPLTVSRVVGPVLGAVMADRLGVASGFFVASGVHFLFVVILTLIRFPSFRVAGAGKSLSARFALLYVIRDRPLLLLLASVAIAGIASEPTITLAPAIVHGLGSTDAFVGTLTAVFGIGAGIGAATCVLAGRLVGEGAVVTLGLGAMASGVALTALVPTKVGVLLGFGIAGLGFTWIVSSAGTLVQIRTPSYLRGRVMAFWIIGFVGCRPVAAAFLGVIADMSSTRVALLSVVVPLLAGMVVCRPKKLCPV